MAVIAAFADSDDRVVVQLAVLDWNVYWRLASYCQQSNTLWRTAEDVVIRQLQDEAEAAEVWGEVDLDHYRDGSGCVCGAVARGWIAYCCYCENGFD